MGDCSAVATEGMHSGIVNSWQTDGETRGAVAKVANLMEIDEEMVMSQGEKW